MEQRNGAINGLKQRNEAMEWRKYVTVRDWGLNHFVRDRYIYLLSLISFDVLKDKQTDGRTDRQTNVRLDSTDVLVY